MIDGSSLEFLKTLLDAPGPSGFEIVPARLWRAEAERIVGSYDADVSGNSLATLNPGGSPRVMLAGHIDEIGLMITHVDDDGFLYFDAIGGWDPQVLVGQRVRMLGRDGVRMGVIGKKPIHLIKSDEQEKASKIQQLWIDCGATSRAQVLEWGIRVGDAAVIDAKLVEFGTDRLVSRSIDNRIGAFVVLEALRRLSRESPRAAAVTAVATAQEEIGYHGGGARACAYSIDPHVAIVVDVTFATDAPGTEKKEVGDHPLGSGPVLARGSAVHPLLVERLVQIADAEGIPYTLQATPKFTATDADAIYLSRAGVPTGVISIPNRYMHSPNEMISLSDVDAAVRLIVGFVHSLDEGFDFIPR
jgi:putative aminopeptidase FrvX